LAVCLFGLRFAFNSTDLRQIIREAYRNEELEQSRGTISRRIDAREETVRELIAQRCSLSQALARFQELDGEWPGHFAELSRTHGRTWSYAEKNYQYIVALVKSLLKDQPKEAAAVLRRVEKDYQQLGAGRQKHRGSGRITCPEQALSRPGSASSCSTKSPTDQ
jgi:hypothetical protein